MVLLTKSSVTEHILYCRLEKTCSGKLENIDKIYELSKSGGVKY